MKLVREYLNEKFTDDDSDPIKDMGIGLVAQLNAKLKQVLERDYRLRWANAEPKDVMRIDSLVKKSKGDSAKERMYARNMANAIEDRAKAYRRYLAAKHERGENWDVTVIFLQRLLEMYGML